MTHASVNRPLRLLLLTAIAACLWLAAAPPVQAQEAGRPGIGILGNDIANEGGAGISVVVPDSSADKAGLKVGDVITAVNGTKVTSAGDLAGQISQFEVDDTVDITFEREGEEKTVEVTLQALDDNSIFPFESGEDPLSPFLPDPDFDEEAPFGDRDPGETSDTNPSSYLPVITLFGILITGFLGTLVFMRIKDRRAELADRSPDDPLKVARLRYAKGEMTREQFRAVMADLGGSPDLDDPQPDAPVQRAKDVQAEDEQPIGGDDAERPAGDQSEKPEE